MYATSVYHPKSPVLPAIRATISSGEDDIQVRVSDQGAISHLVSSPIRHMLTEMDRGRSVSRACRDALGLVFVLAYAERDALGGLADCGPALDQFTAERDVRYRARAGRPVAERRSGA